MYPEALHVDRSVTVCYAGMAAKKSAKSEVNKKQVVKGKKLLFEKR